MPRAVCVKSRERLNGTGKDERGDKDRENDTRRESAADGKTGNVHASKFSPFPSNALQSFVANIYNHDTSRHTAGVSSKIQHWPREVLTRYIERLTGWGLPITDNWTCFTITGRHYYSAGQDQNPERHTYQREWLISTITLAKKLGEHCKICPKVSTFHFHSKPNIVGPRALNACSETVELWTTRENLSFL